MNSIDNILAELLADCGDGAVSKRCRLGLQYGPIYFDGCNGGASKSVSRYFSKYIIFPIMAAISPPVIHILEDVQLSDQPSERRAPIDLPTTSKSSLN
ncbi:hypothetical protein JTB14_012123 [Gonioctena quinquepunctata]|nr:hypothetical protein JTB14_012123 [Gonioctena quinquepunctata]